MNYSRLYEGMPEIYRTSGKNKIGCEGIGCENAQDDEVSRILIEIAKESEKQGRFAEAAIIYNVAGRFPDYLRLMDEAIKKAEEKEDFETAAKLARLIASDDVTITYERLARLPNWREIKRELKGE